jgi:hypothetical protein
MVFCNEPLEKVKFHIFCINFMMVSMEATLWNKSQQKWFCKQVIIGPPFSRMPMIILKVLMYVKLTHKGLLWMALYTPYHLWDRLKNG